MDRMTKSTHFLAIKTTDIIEDYARLYICEIARLDRTPLSIFLDTEELNSHPNFGCLLRKDWGSKVNSSHKHECL